MDRSAGSGVTVRWRRARTSESPLKTTGEEPASIGDVSLCDDTPIERFGVASVAAPPAAPVAAPHAAPLAGGGAQPARAVDPGNDRERARHPFGRPARDTMGEVRFDRSIENDWPTVYVDGAPRLGFQHAPNHVAPDWPDGEQQLHLDLYVDDIAVGHAEVMALGARLLRPAAHHLCARE